MHQMVLQNIYFNIGILPALARLDAVLDVTYRQVGAQKQKVGTRFLQLNVRGFKCRHLAVFFLMFIFDEYVKCLCPVAKACAPNGLPSNMPAKKSAKMEGETWSVIMRRMNTRLLHARESFPGNN